MEDKRSTMKRITKSEKIAAHAALQIKRGNHTEAAIEIAEYADRGVNNRRTEHLFKAALASNIEQIKND